MGKGNNSQGKEKKKPKKGAKPAPPPRRPAAHAEVTPAGRVTRASPRPSPVGPSVG